MLVRLSFLKRNFVDVEVRSHRCSSLHYLWWTYYFYFSQEVLL